MDIEDLKVKVQAAEDKVHKIENTISKYETQKVKKIAALEKLLAENGHNITFDQLKEERADYIYNSKYRDASFGHDYYWACCEVRDKEESIKDNNKKLEEAKLSLKNWQEKLRLEQVKLQYIQDSVPQVIKDFLDEWKRQVIKYYNQKAKEYPEAYQEYKEKKDRLYFDILAETINRLIEEDRETFIHRYCYDREDRLQRVLNVINDGYKPNNTYEYINLIRFNYKDHNDPDEDRRYIQLTEEWKARFGDGFFCSWKDHDFDANWLDKQIEQEKKNKLIDLMTRVSKVTGEIIDASNLTIKNGDLNGYIIGKDGKAEVETIGAGGYNEHVILDSGRRGQCFHFRVLVKPRQ